MDFNTFAMEDLKNLHFCHMMKRTTRMESRCNSRLVWRIHTRCFVLADRGEDGRLSRPGYGRSSLKQIHSFTKKIILMICEMMVRLKVHKHDLKHRYYYIYV